MVGITTVVGPGVFHQMKGYRRAHQLSHAPEHYMCMSVVEQICDSFADYREYIDRVETLATYYTV